MQTLKIRGAALAATLALAACGQQGAPAPEEQSQAIEIYEVPSGQLQSVRSALGTVLRTTDTGAVSISDGRLVVLAPANTQGSIARAIENLSQRPTDAGPASDAPLRLRFWMITGSTGEVSADPRLEPLRPALAEASRALGLRGYTLEGFTDIMASPGRRFSSKSGSIDIHGSAGLTAAGVGVDVTVALRGADGDWDTHIDTDVVLEPGQFLILGTTDAPDGSMRLIAAQARLGTDEA